MKHQNIFLRITLILIINAIILISCKAYSFSGTSIIKGSIKNFSISKCLSEVAMGPNDLDETLRRRVETEIKKKGQIKYLDNGLGDIDFSLTIKKYETSAESTRADSENKVGSLQRLTIDVELTYTNTIDEKASFEKKIYSHFADASADSTIQDEEPRLIKEIFEKIIRDISNDTICDW